MPKPPLFAVFRCLRNHVLGILRKFLGITLNT